MNRLIDVFVTVLFIGYSKWVPGTVASFISIIFLYFIKNKINSYLFIGLFILLFLISIKLITLYSKKYQSHDSSEIVIDEFLAVYLILIFYDYYAFSNTIINLFLIFIFFRFFDMTKTFPANIVDKKIKNSLGVIFDDIIAAIYTITLMIILNAFIA